MSMLEKVKALRDDALQEAMASPAFDMVRALDSAVVAAGGESLIAKPQARQIVSVPTAVVAVAYANNGKKVSQGDAAALALEESGPLPIGRLLEAAKHKGAVFRGENPLPSFRSMMSKDKRFESINRNNIYFWWLNGVDLPEGFMPEPEETELWGSGSNTSQKGGDGHSANNT